MKLYSILLLLIFCSLSASGQTEYIYNYEQGYKFISQAEKALKAGNLEKAEKAIAKAKVSSYGFCGNAWASAHSDINIIEIQILNKQQHYDKALTVLDSMYGCSYGADCAVRDSLKIHTLFLKHGEETVKKAFKNVDTVRTDDLEPYERQCVVFLEELNYRFWFQAPRNVELYIHGRKAEPQKPNNNFHELAKYSKFYKLLQ